MSLIPVIPDILNRKSIFPVADGFRLTTLRNDGTVFGVSLALFTPHYFLHTSLDIVSFPLRNAMATQNLGLLFYARPTDTSEDQRGLIIL